MEKIIKYFRPTPYLGLNGQGFIEFAYLLKVYDPENVTAYQNYINNTRNHFLKESGIEKLIQ